MVDLRGVPYLQVLVEDHRVWVNGVECLFRAQDVGEVRIEDNRSRAISSDDTLLSVSIARPSCANHTTT